MGMLSSAKSGRNKSYGSKISKKHDRTFAQRKSKRKIDDDDNNNNNNNNNNNFGRILGMVTSSNSIKAWLV